MTSLTTLLFVKGLLIGGLGIWLGLGAFNNLMDLGTNRYLLTEMFSMNQLKLDSNMGKGLLHRAVHSPLLVKAILLSVILMQILVVILFEHASYQFFTAMAAHSQTLIREMQAIVSANIALAGYLVLWLFFLCGGLWFGYWMKMGQVQQVHIMVIVIALIALIFINLNGLAIIIKL